MPRKWFDAVAALPSDIPKDVLWPLAYHADADTGECWPKQETLCRELAMSESTLRRRIDAYAMKGWIMVMPTRCPNGHKLNHYRLTIPCPPVKMNGGPPVNMTAANRQDEGSHRSNSLSPPVNLTDRTIREQSNEQSVELGAIGLSSELQEDLKAIREAWNESSGGYTPPTRFDRYIVPLLERHDRDQITEAINAYLRDQKDRRFISPARFAETFGAYINLEDVFESDDTDVPF